MDDSQRGYKGDKEAVIIEEIMGLTIGLTLIVFGFTLWFGFLLGRGYQLRRTNKFIDEMVKRRNRK